jgi:hypothetical protein
VVALIKASVYRQQAHKLRNAAKATNNRATLLKFAEEYDRMAEHPVENQPKKFIKLRWTRGWNSN